MYLVFSQDPMAQPDAERLSAHALRFFASELTVVDRTGAGVRLMLVSTRGAPEDGHEFWVAARDVTHQDLAAARDAEAKGRAAGMGALAERCRRIWELGPVKGSREPPQVAYLTLAAICASVALGPVLPPDHSTLFGVRGAIERRDRSVG